MLAHFGGWGWGGWDDNVPWLAHSGLPALGLHTCWPILVGGGGDGGMILQSTTLHYKVLLRTTKYNSSTTFYYKVQLQYYSVLLQYYSSPNIVLRLSTQISANAAPANKSDTPTSPNNALATRSETPTWPNIAPATKSDTVTVPAVTSDQNLRSQATKTCGHKRPPAPKGRKSPVSQQPCSQRIIDTHYTYIYNKFATHLKHWNPRSYCVSFVALWQLGLHPQLRRMKYEILSLANTPCIFKIPAVWPQPSSLARQAKIWWSEPIKISFGSHPHLEMQFQVNMNSCWEAKHDNNW